MTVEIEKTLATPRLKAIIFTSLAVGFYWISLYLYVPTLPVYTQTFTANLAIVGTVLAQYGLWQAVIRLPLGIVSDWFGTRRPFIFAGIFLAGLGALIMGNAVTVGHMLAGRAVTGFAAGAWVVMVVVFSSLFPPKEAVKATVLLTMVNSVSRVVATGITGSLNDLGGYKLAFTLAAISAVVAALAYLPMTEKRVRKLTPSLRDTGSLLIRKDVLLPSMLNAVTQYAIYATTFGFLPILAKQFGASNIEQSILVSMNIAVGLLGNLVTTTFIKKLGSRAIVLIGFGIVVLGLATLGFTGTLFWIYVAQFLIGFGGGIAYPTLMGMSIEHVDGATRSTAMGLHQAVYAIGMFGGPWLSGILAKWLGVQPMFMITTLMILIMAGIGGRLLEKK